MRRALSLALALALALAPAAPAPAWLAQKGGPTVTPTSQVLLTSVTQALSNSLDK